MKTTSLDIELGIMRKFDHVANLIVPNISGMYGLLAFETDMIVITKSGYAHGFEIKVSKSDLRADFKKAQHIRMNEIINGKTGKERYFGMFKNFSYAVSEDLHEEALRLIPNFCGLYVLENGFLKCKREPSLLFNYKWSNDQMYQAARLGTMRLYNLKSALNSEIKNRKQNQSTTCTHTNS